MKKTKDNIKKFTYGHQFEPEKAHLREYLEIIKTNLPQRTKLEAELRAKFFNRHSASTSRAVALDNQKKLAMNCFLSMRSYGLLKSLKDNEKYELTDLFSKLENTKDDTSLFAEFARHILLNLSGTDYLKAIEIINQQGERPKLNSIIMQLNEMGYELATNSIYPSTMKQWLSKAGLFEGEYTIAWDVFYELTGVDKNLIDSLYGLEPGQKYFLLSLLEINPEQPIEWPLICQHTCATRRIDYDMKLFPKTVLEPLINTGLIQMKKGTVGRGAKPNTVQLTKMGKEKLLVPFLANLASLVQIDSSNLNKPFSKILEDIDSKNIHIKGRALELLAVWIIRLCSLRFIEWRKRDNETGSGEVDVLAASDTFIYNRWQIQCKNSKKVDVDTICKEVGMMLMTRSDIVMVITTGSFTSAAISYADAICSRERFYVILLDGEKLHQLKNNKHNLIPILHKLAKRTFVRKEYALTSSEADNLVKFYEKDLEDSSS